MTCFVKSTSGFGSGYYLFPNYIHDLPNGVTHSTVGLFAYDCILHRHVTDKNDINRLQMNLDRISKWEETWLMEFNVSKCFAREVDPKWIHPCIDSMARCSVLKNHKIHGTYHHFRSEME